MNARPLWLSLSILVAGAPTCRAEKPAAVQIAQPLVRQVTDHEDFAGRTDAAQTVQVRARVTGYIVNVAFKDGADVKKGEVLFEIDPRPYQAEVAKAEAGVVQSEARLKLAKTDYQRARAIRDRAPGAISREEFDKIAAEVEVAEATLVASKAALEAARIIVDFTRVTAPIAGRIGRRLLDAGNLVQADKTLLTTIVSRDPMYVCFNVDERTFLRLERTRREGKEEAKLAVTMGIADEQGFPRRGTVEFTDGRVDSATGTIRVRAVFANADGVLVPGLFVRVRLPIGQAYQALLVPEAAIASGEGQRIVYVVNDKNVVEVRRVQMGSRQDGGLRALSHGLREGEWVVVGSQRNVRPGVTVTPEKVTLPLKAPEAKEETAPRDK